MPTFHAWQSCIDMTPLPQNEREHLSQALNWLEEYFPDFNEMVYEIKQGQKAGKLEKIKTQPGMEVQAVISWMEQGCEEISRLKAAARFNANRDS